MLEEYEDFVANVNPSDIYLSPFVSTALRFAIHDDKTLSIVFDFSDPILEKYRQEQIVKCLKFEINCVIKLESRNNKTRFLFSQCRFERHVKVTDSKNKSKYFHMFYFSYKKCENLRMPLLKTKLIGVI